MQGRQTHHRIANPGRRAYDDAFDFIRHEIAQGQFGSAVRREIFIVSVETIILSSFRSGIFRS